MDSIETIVIDCDGVLTDGKLYIDSTGKKMFKAFHSRDVRAMHELVAKGYRVIIVTADGGDINKAFAKKVRCEIIVARDKSNLGIKNYIAIGDDAWDVKMLEQAAIAYCPADAHESVLKVNNITVLNTAGGLGCIAELIDQLLL